MNGEDIIDIQDITPFVIEQYKFVEAKELDDLVIPKETIYPLTDPQIIKQIRLGTPIEQ